MSRGRSTTGGWASPALSLALQVFAPIATGPYVVGIVALDDETTCTHLSAGCPPDGRFEIGSVTKTMTATLLAGLAHEGVLDLDDPIGDYLDAGHNGDVTLRALATHTSGLPTLGPDLEARRRSGSGSTLAMTPEAAEAALRRARRDQAPGFRYSNFGYQLLGMAVERATGLPYPRLLDERLLRPLGMRQSGIGKDAGGPLVPGHGLRRPIGRIRRPLPAAGGVEATLDDLARYLQACVHPPEGHLGQALWRTQQPEGIRRDARREVGLAWMLLDGGRLLTHTGSTPGFSTAVAADRHLGRAFGVLHNRAGGSMALGAATLLLLGQLSRTSIGDG